MNSPIKLLHTYEVLLEIIFLPCRPKHELLGNHGVRHTRRVTSGREKNVCLRIGLIFSETRSLRAHLELPCACNTSVNFQALNESFIAR